MEPNHAIQFMNPLKLPEAIKMLQALKMLNVSKILDQLLIFLFLAEMDTAFIALHLLLMGDHADLQMRGVMTC